MNPEIDWSKFEPVKQQDIDWNQFEPVEEQKKQPSTAEEGIRHIARTGSDIANTLIGTPGNIRDFLGSILEYGQEKLPESVSEPIQKGKEAFKSTAVGKLVSAFPTTSELEKKSQERSDGYLSPKTEIEKSGSELVKDITAFSTPGTGAFKLAKNIGIPVAGLLAKEGVKFVGGSDDEQNYAKLGVMLPLSLMNPGGAKKHAADLFKISESIVPQGSVLNASPIQQALQPIKTKLQTGGSAPSKVEALKKISEIEGKIKNNQMEVHDALQFRKDINEVLERSGGFDVPKGERTSAIRNLNDVKNAIMKGIEDYSKGQPKFAELNNAANESYAVIQASNRIANTIKKAAKKPFVSEAMKYILMPSALGTIGYSAYTNPLLTGSVALGTTGIYQGAKILERISKSPTLRSYYTNVIQSGMTNNIPSLTLNLEKLDKALKKEEDKQINPQRFR